MTETQLRREFQDLPRVLGAWPPNGESTRPGERLLVVIGGLHGNEPAGVRAIRDFFRDLEASGLRPRGRVLGLAGNRSALARGERYAEQDLNRLWAEERVRLGAAPDHEPATAEEREQREILAELESALATGPSRVYLLDLHSTSAAGSPFAIMSDTLQNRRVAETLGIPVLLGLEERVQGTLLSWFSELGHTALCVEGGQNEEPSTSEHLLSVIWMTLVAAGFLDPGEVAELAHHRGRLAATAWGLPEFCEIQYRHEVLDGVDFRMEPGFTNFHLVRRGDHLATVFGEDDAQERVLCPQDGQLIMPRYQGQGNDGFFLGNEVPLWALRLSAVVRRLRLGPLLRLLPGVHRDRERKRGLVVDQQIARWRTVEILHLFGYRRCAREGHRLYFLRRPDRFS